LSSTTKNINDTYKEISTASNLHDATVSENYVIGNAQYAYYDGSNATVDDSNNSYIGTEAAGGTIP
jgi:hypothetical protein